MRVNYNHVENDDAIAVSWNETSYCAVARDTDILNVAEAGVVQLGKGYAGAAVLDKADMEYLLSLGGSLCSDAEASSVGDALNRYELDQWLRC